MDTLIFRTRWIYLCSLLLCLVFVKVSVAQDSNDQSLSNDLVAQIPDSIQPDVNTAKTQEMI